MAGRMPVTFTVHVVDDDGAVRDSLHFVLESEGLAVQTYDSAAALMRAQPGPSGCILTDFHMPEIDGLQLQAQLAAMAIRLPVIVMTGHGDVPAAVRAMKAGAVDFLEKPFKDGELVEAIERARERNRADLAASARSMEAVRRIATLTRREREVLDLLVTGKSNKEMANILGTSPRTIDVHRARVYAKLAAGSLPDLVHMALAAGAAIVPR